MSENRLPKGLLKRLPDIYGPEDREQVLKGLQEDRPVTFRVNTLKSNESEVESFLQSAGMEFEKISFLPLAYSMKKDHEYALKGSDIFYGGKIYVQGIASQLPALFLDVQKGQSVLDVTAAPGSKTTQIAALANNEVEIVACEQNQIRFDKLNYNIKLQGALGVETLKMDAAKLSNHFSLGYFDSILLDAPCSAEGRISLDNEKTYGFWTEENIKKKAVLQRNLLEAVYPLLKSGGTLVYSTCTLAPEENEGLVNAFLKDHPDASLDKIELDFEFARPGVTAFRGANFDESLVNTLRILPSNLSEGFFIAKIKKA